MTRKFAFIVVSLVLASCGTNKQTDQSSANLTVATPSAQSVRSCEKRTPPAPAKEANAGTSKPDVKIPGGAPPCDLVIQDIYTGTGAEVKAGDTVTVQYVGVSWSTGQQFDASWDGGQPVTFGLGEVVQGWQQGIPGMKVGGRRQLIIPPDLAYGAEGRPGIAPNETLVFVIDLIKVG